jgi:anion-transporting  ArsA/GET3 family ATPase
MSTQVLICCGAGGVGKTTVSAALALSWARQGHKVAVLTIDPARRLADSLGIEELDDTPTPVPVGPGSLDAMMLDPSRTFDELVNRLAPTPEVAATIRANRHYRFSRSRLSGVQEYMAMERLLDMREGGSWDTIILDTPPTHHALDFLKAPSRMANLMDQGVLRWLAMPASKGGWRALEFGSEAVARVLKRLMGQQTIQEVAEFFEAFRGLWDGFRLRALRVNLLLRDPQTRFFLVTSAAPNAHDDALHFLRVLQAADMPFGGFILNRVSPTPTTGELHVPATLGHLSATLAQAREQALILAESESRATDALLAHGPQGAPCWRVPLQAEDVHDLEGLGRLGPHLPTAGELGFSPPR